MMAFSTASRGMSLLVVLILSFKMTIQQPLGEPSPEILHRVKRVPVYGGIPSKEPGAGTIIPGEGGNDNVIIPVLFNYDLSREELTWLIIRCKARKANHGSSIRGGAPTTQRNQQHAYMVSNEDLDIVCQSLNNHNNQRLNQRHHNGIPRDNSGQPSSGSTFSFTHGGHSHDPQGNVVPPKSHGSVHTHQVLFPTPDPHVYIGPNVESIPIFSN